MEHWFQDMVAVAFELAWEWMVCGKTVGARARFWKRRNIYFSFVNIFGGSEGERTEN